MADRAVDAGAGFDRRGDGRADRVGYVAGAPRLERDAGGADERARDVQPVGDAAERGAESVAGVGLGDGGLERAGFMDVEDRHDDEAGYGDGHRFVRESHDE